MQSIFVTMICQDPSASAPPTQKYWVGCVPDLVHDGDTGLHYRVDDTNGPAQAIARILNEDGLRGRLAANAKVRIQPWSLDETRAGILRAAQTVKR
ncbi:MAG: glycosyltransferase involved in cell wall biosynthesis [Gammaproteobacteria bacterium]|jgi:glycosyltransferase involved in cell wall biosynthesis